MRKVIPFVFLLLVAPVMAQENGKLDLQKLEKGKKGMMPKDAKYSIRGVIGDEISISAETQVECKKMRVSFVVKSKELADISIKLTPMQKRGIPMNQVYEVSHIKKIEAGTRTVSAGSSGKQQQVTTDAFEIPVLVPVQVKK